MPPREITPHEHLCNDDLLHEGATYRIAFNAPFYTGVWIDTQALIAGQHGRDYRQVVNEVTSKLGDGWTGAEAEFSDERQEFDVDTYSGRPAVPLFFAQYHTPDPDGCPRVFATDLLNVTVEGVDIKFFDFGVGTITTEVSVTPRSHITFREFRGEVESIGRGGNLDHKLSVALSGALSSFTAALPRESWSADLAGSSLSGRGHESIGRSLWTHRVYFVCVAEGESASQGLERWSSHLLPPMPTKAMQTVDCAGVSFLPGIGSSLATHAKGETCQPLLHAIELQNAYWAAAALLDRTLLRVISVMSVETRHASLNELERRSDDIYSLFERVRVFGMVQNTLLGILPPLQATTWSVLADAWLLDAQIAAVKDKTDALMSLYHQLVESASSKRNKFLNTIVVAFTALSLAQLLFAAMAFAQSKSLGLGHEPAVAVSLAVLALSLLVTIVVVLRADRIENR